MSIDINHGAAQDVPKFTIPNGSAMPDKDGWTNRFMEKSTSSNSYHVISQHKHNRHWACSCTGWTTHRKCKHLAKYGLPANEVPFEAVTTYAENHVLPAQPKATPAKPKVPTAVQVAKSKVPLQKIGTGTFKSGLTPAMVTVTLLPLHMPNFHEHHPFFKGFGHVRHDPKVVAQVRKNLIKISLPFLQHCTGRDLKDESLPDRNVMWFLQVLSRFVNNINVEAPAMEKQLAQLLWVAWQRIASIDDKSREWAAGMAQGRTDEQKTTCYHNNVTGVGVKVTGDAGVIAGSKAITGKPHLPLPKAQTVPMGKSNSQKAKIAQAEAWAMQEQTVQPEPDAFNGAKRPKRAMSFDDLD